MRTTKIANGIFHKSALTNVSRWFSVEASHPEIQGEVKAAWNKDKEKSAAASKAGVNIRSNIGLKYTDNGVGTWFPPEPL